MRRFNDARVAVKHKGLLPIQQQIEEFRFTVTAFLNDATPKVFQIEFDSISLSSLVRADDVRSELQAAETAAEAGEFGKALEQAAKAFHLSLRNHRWFETPRLFDPTDAARGLWQRGQSLSDFNFTRSFEAVARMGRTSARRSRSWPTILTMTDTDTFGPTARSYALWGSAAWLRIGRGNPRQID
jgi:hypothetical protein